MTFNYEQESLRSEELTQEHWATFAFESNDASNLYTATQELKFATLAVAEQLRLANLIAMTTAEQRDGVRFTKDMLSTADPTREED